MRSSWPRVAIAGLVGGFVGNGVLGALFSSAPVRRVRGTNSIAPTATSATPEA